MLSDLTKMAADSHKDSNLVEMNASYYSEFIPGKVKVFFLHDLIYLDLPALCVLHVI